MNAAPRLLVWNFTPQEKAQLDETLAAIKAPSAFAIADTQGRLPLRDIIHSNSHSAQPFECAEKILLFYNIPQKGVYFLLQAFKSSDLPKPIYAVVTEHSIDWPFSELANHLIVERDAVERTKQNG